MECERRPGTPTGRALATHLPMLLVRPQGPGWRDSGDLQALGQLDDGTVSTIDAGHLRAFRMEQAGLDVTLDEYPGATRFSASPKSWWGTSRP